MEDACEGKQAPGMSKPRGATSPLQIAAGRRHPPSHAGCLVLIGVSHQGSPVAMRERLLAGAAGAAATSPAVQMVAEMIRRQFGPAVVLSTCNRWEAYCWTLLSRSAATVGLVRLLGAHAGLSAAELRPHVYLHTGIDAAQHLMRVTAGLDSLALGESQILGQVRAAWQEAAALASLGPELDSVFRRAIEAARRIRNLGAFDRHPSVAAIAVGAGARAAGNIAGRSVAVLGAGATGQAAVRALVSAGARHVTLVNRSPERAASAVQALYLGDRVSAAPLEALPQALIGADVIICATSAATHLVSVTVVAEALRQRGEQPLVLVDIAVPRDVEPAVRHLPGAQLIDLDDLEARCMLDGAHRRRELDRAETLAREAAESCMAALRAREAVPDIIALRRQAEAIRAGELRRAAGRLSRLAPAERAAVEQVTYAIVQKLLHPPITALRRNTAARGPAARRARAMIVSSLSAPDTLA